MSQLTKRTLLAMVVVGSALLAMSAPARAALQAQSMVWHRYANGNHFRGSALDDALWAAASGEVERWNCAKGAYVKYTTLQGWTTYTTADGLGDNRVYAIAIDAAGHKWFGTHGGVSEFDGQRWTTYTTADGLADNYVLAIAIDDATGHKWFGTRGGVSEFDGQLWITYTTADGLADNNVRSIAIDATGHKWFGTEYGGVSEFDGQRWTTYTTADGLAENRVDAIAIDHATQHKWFGTWHGGVSEFDGQRWTTYTTADGLADNNVFAIAIDDAAGHKWFATYTGGVSEFDGQRWTTYTTADGLVNNYVHAIAIDQVGHKWFGTYGGVSKFDGQGWTTYTTADGLANNDVLAIAVDAARHKWFCTWGGGVSEFFQGTRLFLPVVMRGYPPLWCDPYERNDDCQQAYGPLQFDRGYVAYICAVDPQDWYYLDLGAAEPITIDLAVPAAADYELYLYDGCGVQQPVAWSNESGYGVDEQITYHASPGRHYIRVYPAAGSYSDSAPYVLEVHR